MPKSQIKEYEPCEICRYDIYTELHHPHGRRVALFQRLNGDVMEIPRHDLQKHIDSGIFIVEADVYCHPYAVVSLCPSCHKNFTRFKYSLDYLIKSTIDFFSRCGYNCSMVGTGGHIRNVNGTYEFHFSESEMAIPISFNKGRCSTNFITGIRQPQEVRNHEIFDRLKQSGW